MTLADWPDVERAVGDFLAPLGATGSETPQALQSQVPYLRIGRTGGADDRTTDRANVSIDVFAADADTARQVAGQVRQMLLLKLPAVTAHGVIDWASTNSAPFMTPPTDSDNLRLCAANYTVSMRRG